MKSASRRLAGTFALVAACQIEVAAGASFCRWVTSATSMTFRLDAGSVYVPRDAAPGHVIGEFDRSFSMPSTEGQIIHCENDLGSTLTFNAVASAPLFPGILPPVNGEDVNGKVFMTGIDGIGARIKLQHPFDGIAADAFVPSTEPTVPFNALLHAAVPASAPLRIDRLQGKLTLIKTGPIAPGPHTFDKALFGTRFSNIGNGFDFQLSGTVLQAQCGISSVSANPVPLGDWRTSDFGAVGPGTPAVPFNITLGNCDADPGDINIAWANIRLEPTNGSVPIPGVEGGFTLGAGSGATGVGIQILKADGVTPVPLQREVPLAAISPGTTVLDLSARLYQTAPKVDAGAVKGSLNFTVSFH
ncbi:fimbrial protein [Pseudomonas beijingensis]|jgi:type 1 fimbria pilin|uniref:Fimbrial protein n=1 Tax=Pseudomonas beijingensis TaxID=2954101 RepID=A0ABY9FAH9_9PSED|nr:fimbrial protein [Pseudomonas sp. FP2034]WLG99822.1 fimbrial protein [Pseudomonas sp. FP2034]